MAGTPTGSVPSACGVGLSEPGSPAPARRSAATTSTALDGAGGQALAIDDTAAIWTPSRSVQEAARITDFQSWLARGRGLDFAGYEDLWRWSVDHPGDFWQALCDWAGLPGAGSGTPALADASMPGARWFPGVRLNYVEQVFRHADASRPAIVHENEAGERGEMAWEELRRQVAALAASLRRLGVQRGDRVVAILPNIAQTVVAFLAVASVGAIWSACSPDMGQLAVLDRFRQIEPKVMIAVDGYRYAGKPYARLEWLQQLVAELPSVQRVIVVPLLDADCGAGPLANGLAWADAIAGDAPLVAEPLDFDHPLWIVYSSGTTGLPKAIVHGHGGIVLEHVKLCALHLDLHAGDRFHWYSSTGWIMWNLQVAALLVGATPCLYDGSPTHPDPGALWRFLGRAGVEVFGAGAAYYLSCMKQGVEPLALADLSALRCCGSTGSPLPPEAYRWIIAQVGALWINAVAGGTDIASAFLAGVPTLPVHAGEMQCRCLGARVEAFDDSGRPLVDEVGELVCTAPMPSMPLRFWNDPGDARYRASYFDVYPGVWRHGDWLRITPRGGGVIYGRSDATINRHGIRMGTSELYRAVEQVPEVLDSLVVDLEYLGRESYMPLFVVLRPGQTLSPQLEARIRLGIRQALSARHVPDAVFQVQAIPRTLTGKKLELPIKKLLLGRPLSEVLNLDTLANPESVEWFVGFARSRGAQPA